MKIAFVGNFEYNCGSSNTILGYIRAGKTLGYDIRVSDFGNADKTIRNSIPIASKNWKPDLMVIIYESYPFLSNETIERICSYIPRSKRILIDPDGKYLPPISTENDTNHPTKDSYKYWTNLYDSLSDIVLQPCINMPHKANIKKFFYFGIGTKTTEIKKQHKDFELAYVGNNWYRWHDIEWLVKITSSIRSILKRIALIGQFWSGEVMEEFKEATYSEPELLQKNQIEVYEPAPYGQVEKAMGRSYLHPIFIRPILCKIEFVTPRMFETLLADTLPVIPPYFTYANKLYGKNIEKFTLYSDDPTKDIANIFNNYKANKKVVDEIRWYLKVNHSYEVRLKELTQFV